MAEQGVEVVAVCAQAGAGHDAVILQAKEERGHIGRPHVGIDVKQVDDFAHAIDIALCQTIPDAVFIEIDDAILAVGKRIGILEKVIGGKAERRDKVDGPVAGIHHIGGSATNIDVDELAGSGIRVEDERQWSRRLCDADGVARLVDVIGIEIVPLIRHPAKEMGRHGGGIEPRHPCGIQIAIVGHHLVADEHHHTSGERMELLPVELLPLAPLHVGVVFVPRVLFPLAEGQGHIDERKRHGRVGPCKAFLAGEDGARGKMEIGDGIHGAGQIVALKEMCVVDKIHLIAVLVSLRDKHPAKDLVVVEAQFP